MKGERSELRKFNHFIYKCMEEESFHSIHIGPAEEMEKITYDQVKKLETVKTDLEAALKMIKSGDMENAEAVLGNAIGQTGQTLAELSQVKVYPFKELEAAKHNMESALRFVKSKDRDESSLAFVIGVLENAINQTDSMANELEQIKMKSFEDKGQD